MSMGSQPSPPSPQESAAGQATAEQAGMMLEGENAPVMSYENAITSGELGPYQNELASAQNEQNQYAQAAGDQAIEYATNPQAYEAQQMQMQGANSRLAALYGVSPKAYSAKAPGVFSLPSTSMLPNLGAIGNTGRAIGSQIGGIAVGPNSVGFVNPQNPQYYLPA
jgi:hypothetical protein